MNVDELKAKLQGTKEDRDAGMVVLNELIAVAVATKEFVEVETDPDLRHVNFQRVVEHPMFLVPGLNFSPLVSHLDGRITFSKGIIKAGFQLEAKALGNDTFKDLRVIMPPHCLNNKLVPTMCFIDSVKVLDFYNNKL